MTLNTSHAFVVTPIQVAHLNTEHDVWKPSGAVRLTESVACARVHQDGCEDGSHNTTAICTFDGGKSLSVQQTQFPFCGDKGVVIDGALLCPLKPHRVNESVINMTVVSFEGEASLEETVKDTTMLSFAYWPGKEITEVGFKGNTIFFSEDHSYLMNVVVTLKNSSSEHVLFYSRDGYIWKALSKIPLDTADESALARHGRQRITVSAYSTREHRIVSSSYKGKWWGHIKFLNASISPSTLFLSGSGVLIESGLSNRSSPLELSGFVEDNTKSKVVRLVDLYREVASSNQLPNDFTTGCNGNVTCLTSSQVTFMDFQHGHVIALFDFVSTETQRKTIAGVTLKIDDSEEVGAILEEKKRAEELVKLREESRKKAQQEREERKKRERQEKRKKDLERLARFAVADAGNIKMAKERELEDGEMIVVRDVVEDLIDIEKQTFFW
ncbi:hypothetical protein DQ04_00191280 [Trypanosoma grayi]|uniref:hypothetical protein n=1 Tax=Trypanosoma grayi TaxID=71804 RepID=UPI0004F4446B|nr:hypothetical protein DQ04_00191280 [Trypanosoma grayi]KEG15104.1 hypothetical protein DQ04_00191280 [Trypanosoma grayi]